MSHHARGFGEPTWQEGNPAPYVKFITLCTYELQTTLGRMEDMDGRRRRGERRQRMC